MHHMSVELERMEVQNYHTFNKILSQNLMGIIMLPQ